MGKTTGFFSFIAGAVFGAVIALLYAPTSGEELAPKFGTKLMPNCSRHPKNGQRHWRMCSNRSTR